MRWFALLVAICLLFSVAPASAWNGYTHKVLWQTAVKEAGIDLSSCGKVVTKRILEQAPTDKYASKNKRDHNCFSTFCPALDKMNDLIEKAKLEGNFCQKMFMLAQASHYYTDSKNPVHMSLADPKCHSKFEKSVDKYIKGGFKSVVKIKCKKPKAELTFNNNDFNMLVKGINEEILSVVR